MVAESSYVHPSAVLIGDVIVGPNCYVGPCACLRGDFGRITICAGSNVQDTCVVHSFPGRDVTINECGHIGHGAVLHGCIVGRNAFVGMNAVVMDGVVVNENAFVAAAAFVKSDFVVPAASLVAGVPARVVRDLTPEEIAWKTNGTELYHRLARRSSEGMTAVPALREPEPGRGRVQWETDAATPLSELRSMGFPEPTGNR